MSPEAQRIAIAQACGYKRLTQHEAVWSHKGSKIYTAGNLPNYLDSLDAMHEAEKTLSWKDEGSSTSERRRYLMNLEAVISGPIDRFGDRPDRTLSVPFATAAQRAEAFLRVLGKWQD